MVKEGWYFGLPLLAVGVVCWLAGWHIAAAVPLFLAAFCFYFFRNPNRSVPQEPGAIVSPADGRVVVLVPEERDGRPGTRLSIFLAVWNVHVNRSPAAGTIKSLEYRRGKFFAAMGVRASLENEQNVFRLVTEAGEMEFKQIAGYIARRVVSWKKVGDRVARGELIGLVRFGSRMDVWLPEGARVTVKVGNHVKGGSSVLGYWDAQSSSLKNAGGVAESSATDRELTATEKLN